MSKNLVWEDYFYYDETSPSCLRWKVSIYSGRGLKRLNVKENDPVQHMDIEGYFIVGLNRKRYRVHRIIFEMFNGKIPKAAVIDHIDRNKGNNKIENLRAVDNRVNSRNAKRYSSNSSGVNGVSVQTSYKPSGNYSAYVANWVDLQGVKHGKSFSIIKYGREVALRLAEEYRLGKIAELNNQGAGYHDNHGEDCDRQQNEQDLRDHNIERMFEAVKQGEMLYE